MLTVAEKIKRHEAAACVTVSKGHPSGTAAQHGGPICDIAAGGEARPASQASNYGVVPLHCLLNLLC